MYLNNIKKTISMWVGHSTKLFTEYSFFSSKFFMEYFQIIFVSDCDKPLVWYERIEFPFFSQFFTRVYILDVLKFIFCFFLNCVENYSVIITANSIQYNFIETLSTWNFYTQSFIIIVLELNVSNLYELINVSKLYKLIKAFTANSYSAQQYREGSKNLKTN